MAQPKVTLVVPCYNHGAYIEDALASVAAQTFRDYELIVVNDGSTDGETNEVLNRVAASGINVLRTENRGPAAARNLAISLARGEYILPLDADDRVAPLFLEKAVAVLDRCPDVRVVCGRVEFFGDRCGEWVQPDYLPSRLLMDNMILVTSLFRRADWERVGGYCEEMRSGWEDWDFWLSVLAGGGEVVRLDEFALYYRICIDSRDRSLGKRRKLALMLKLLTRHRAFYLKYWYPCMRTLARKFMNLKVCVD